MGELFAIFGILLCFIAFFIVVLLIGSYIAARFILPWFNWLTDMYTVWNEEFKARHEDKGDKK